jgi:outer membrane protein OmpA-like peptidoglycan-associated protein
MFTCNVGGELPIVRRYGITAVGGVYINVPLLQLPDSVTQVPAEALLGLRWYSSLGVTITTGLSFGGDCTIKVPSLSWWLAAVWVPAKTREYAAIEAFKQPPVDPDGDGLIGDADWCPNEKGPVENHGCPIRDFDKDGIPDQYDDCPELPGLKQYNGCPRVYRSENKIKVLERVNFATDQDIILPESFGILEEAAELINAHKEWQEILIEGHCDSRASDAYNLDLSQRRANSVMRFLLQHGVDPSRLRAEGFGRSRPLPGVDGTTEAGMALNRRVEFTILKVAPGSAPLTSGQAPAPTTHQVEIPAPAGTPGTAPATAQETPSAGGAASAGSLGGHK